MKKTRWLRTLSLLLVIGVSSGCLNVKLNGFQEIAERHPKGLEDAVLTDEGAAFVKDLGRYINQLEQQLEEGD
jgi:hypothetical protein